MPEAGAGPEAPLVEVILDDDRWHGAGIEPLAERAARAVLAAVGRDPDRHEIALLACSDARIASLNADFRGQPAPTNVLSWPEFDRPKSGPESGPGLGPESGAVPRPVPEPGSDPEERLFLGDIAIAYEICRREAEAAGIGFADHVSHLVVHGVLHLLGYDHEHDADAEVMESLEANVLASMGIANPYSHEERPRGASPG